MFQQIFENLAERMEFLHQLDTVVIEVEPLVADVNSLVADSFPLAKLTAVDIDEPLAVF